MRHSFVASPSKHAKCKCKQIYNDTAYKLNNLSLGVHEKFL